MGTHKILIFGEGRHLLRTICRVLEYEGYYVRLAPSLKDALAHLARQNYDLVIAKLGKEDLESLEVLKRAKELNPKVRSMVVNGNASAAFPLESYRIEVDDYLLFPLTPSELMRRVARCLEEVVELKPSKPRPVRAATRASEQLVSRIMIILHDIRGSLVSTGASLKLLERGKFGAINPRAADQTLELLNRIQSSTDLIDKFAHEVLSAPGQGTAINRNKGVAA